MLCYLPQAQVSGVGRMSTCRSVPHEILSISRIRRYAINWLTCIYESFIRISRIAGYPLAKPSSFTTVLLLLCYDSWLAFSLARCTGLVYEGTVWYAASLLMWSVRRSVGRLGSVRCLGLLTPERQPSSMLQEYTCICVFECVGTYICVFKIEHSFSYISVAVHFPRTGKEERSSRRVGAYGFSLFYFLVFLSAIPLLNWWANGK